MNRRQPFDIPQRKHKQYTQQVKFSDTEFNTFYPMDKSIKIPDFKPQKETKNEEKEQKEERQVFGSYDDQLQQVIEMSKHDF